MDQDILSALSVLGEASCQQIAVHIRKSWGQVHEAIQRLEKCGILMRRQEQTGKQGRPRIFFHLTPQDDYDGCMCGDSECPECNPSCHYCGGEGYGAYGEEWDNPDPLWYRNGEIIRCPCCGGSGLAKDCTFW